MKTKTGVGVFHDVRYEAGRNVVVSYADCTATLPTLSLEFVGPRYADEYGITQNQCWPSTLIDDAGFALFSDDPWYTANQDRGIRDLVSLGLYENPPGPEYTNFKVNRGGWYRRRSPDLGLQGDNTTHHPVEVSLGKQSDLEKCWEEDRAGETEPAFAASQLAPSVNREQPRRATAKATAANSFGEEVVMVTAKAAVAGRGVQELLERSQPTRTSIAGREKGDVGNDAAPVI